MCFPTRSDGLTTVDYEVWHQGASRDIRSIYLMHTHHRQARYTPKPRAMVGLDAVPIVHYCTYRTPFGRSRNNASCMCAAGSGSREYKHANNTEAGCFLSPPPPLVRSLSLSLTHCVCLSLCVCVCVCVCMCMCACVRVLCLVCMHAWLRVVYCVWVGVDRRGSACTRC